MGEHTEIAWCDHTFNPWRGCTKISPGCANCYAEKMSHRNPAVLGEWGPGAKRVIGTADYLDLPYRWNAAAHKAGKRRRVFCASLADVFDEAVPDHWRDLLFNRILEGTDYLDWLILTKRPANAKRYLGALGPMPETIREHLWLGVSVENQDHVNRIATLMQIPAAVHFVSAEPLLGPIEIPRYVRLPGGVRGDGPWHSTIAPAGVYCAHFNPHGAVAVTATNGEILGVKPAEFERASIDWVIVGGESGPKARPMHPDWARSLRDQCNAAGVPFLFKQWGEWAPDDCGAPAAAISKAPLYSWNGAPDYACVHRVGKKAAGRLLDGRRWDEYPEARS